MTTLKVGVKTEPIRFELGDEQTTLDNVNSVGALRAAAEYFALLASSATDDGGEVLDLHGLALVNKCTAFAANTTDPPRARRAIAKTHKWTSGMEVVPPKYKRDVERFRKTMRTLPYRARTTFSNETIDLEVPALEAKPGQVTLESIDTLRAELIEIGGDDPMAEFKSATETEDFSLRLNRDMAHHLGACLYEEVEIRVQIRRDDADHIVGGEVLEFAPIPDSSPKEVIAAWREYHKQVGSPWDAIKDIEKELGRG